MQSNNSMMMMGGMTTASKKKRNRKRKNKEGKLTAEEIHSMPTDDLCNYIENKANAQNEGMPTNRMSSNSKSPGIPGAAISAISKLKKKVGMPMSNED